MAGMQTQQNGVEKANDLVRGVRGATQESDLDRVSKDFEAVFITEMLRPIFDSVEVNSMFGGGRAEEVFRSMMLDEYGKTISRAGGIGFADDVKAELIKIQEAQMVK